MRERLVQELEFSHEGTRKGSKGQERYANGWERTVLNGWEGKVYIGKGRELTQFLTLFEG